MHGGGIQFTFIYYICTVWGVFLVQCNAHYGLFWVNTFLYHIKKLFISIKLFFMECDCWNIFNYIQYNLPELLGILVFPLTLSHIHYYHKPSLVNLLHSKSNVFLTVFFFNSDNIWTLNISQITSLYSIFYIEYICFCYNISEHPHPQPFLPNTTPSHPSPIDFLNV